MNSKIYVTTTIAYVNACPHIGFALELVHGDVIARYSKLIGNETRFQTGTDENALKNVLAARQEGLETQEFVDRNSETYRRVGEALNISSDSFIRTTEPRHRRAVHVFWERLRPQDVYRTTYRGLYCTGCEDFYLEKDLVNGCCPDHGTAPIEIKEDNYFFRLSGYQARIEELLATDRIKVIPTKRKNEVLSFVRGGLRDFSISRDARRAEGWGIPVPGDESQVVYVWVDALINYISGLGFGERSNWSDVWNDRTRKIHVIGKNVWKFHAVYWPALLLSAGLSLPNEIIVHGFLTIEGRKISKSLGNTVDPLVCVEKYGQDAVRYYLLCAVSPFDDGDFSPERLKQVYNADLANGLGNLLSRLTNLAHRAGLQRCACAGVPAPPKGYTQALERYEFDRAAETLWAIVTKVNQDIERTKPWEALKSGNPESLKNHLTRWLDELYRVGYWLQPLLPETANKVLQVLKREPIRSCEPLFPRIA